MKPSLTIAIGLDLIVGLGLRDNPGLFIFHEHLMRFDIFEKYVKKNYNHCEYSSDEVM